MCVSGAEDIPAALAAAEAAVGNTEQAVKDFAKVDFHSFFSFFFNSAPCNPWARRSTAVKDFAKVVFLFYFILTQRRIIHGQYGASG